MSDKKTELQDAQGSTAKAENTIRIKEDRSQKSQENSTDMEKSINRKQRQRRWAENQKRDNF